MEEVEEAKRSPPYKFSPLTSTKLEIIPQYVLVRHGQKIWRHNLAFQNDSILRRPRGAKFTDIIKIATMFIKKSFKDSKKIKIIRN